MRACVAEEAYVNPFPSMGFFCSPGRVDAMVQQGVIA